MNEFKRKQWARIGLSLIAVIVATLFLTGIIGGEHMTYSLTEKADAPAVNGTAVEEAEQGFGGTVTVKATLDGSTVQALKRRTKRPGWASGHPKKISPASLSARKARSPSERTGLTRSPARL